MNKSLITFWILASGATYLPLNAAGQQAITGGEPLPASAPQSQPDQNSGLQEIIVTAERKEESLQRAPVAISTVSGDTLREANISSSAQLTSLVPALQVQDADGPYALFYLRGVGDFASNGLSDSAVAFNFDNVYIGRPSSTDGYFYDVDRVEVLKGPQGTLYGRNATGGAINVISNVPKLNEFGVDASLEYGNYNEIRTDAALNLPLGSIAAVRGAFFHLQHTGYMNDGTSDQDDTGGRLSFLVEPVDGLRAVLVGDYFKQEGKGNGATIIGPTGAFPGPAFAINDRIGLSSPQGAAFLAGQPNALSGNAFGAFPNNQFNNNESFGVSSTITWKTPVGTLSVIPAYRGSNLDYLSDVPGFQITENSRDRQTSFETRFASTDEYALRYLLGLYYYDETNNVPNFDVNSQAQLSIQTQNTDTVSKAVFGRLTYAFTDALRINGGVRYTKENKEFSGTLAANNKICVFGFLGCAAATPFPYNLYTALPPNFIPGPDGTITTFTSIDNTGANNKAATYSKVTWHGGIDWDVTDRNLLYATAETGFKAGGFFFSSDSGVYEPETITAYTIGSKNRFLENRLQANLEIYYWKYKNQQVSHLGEDSNGTIIFPTQNVGTATFKGIELEAQYLPLTNTLLGADILYNDAVYNSFVYNVPNTNGGASNGTACPNTALSASSYTVDCSGNRPPNAPLWTIVVSAQQIIPLSNGANIKAIARGHFQTATLTALDFLPAEVSPSYAKADFSLTYSTKDDHFYVGGFVNNAFNKTVFNYSSAVPFAFFLAGSLEPPRTFGIRVGTHF